MAFTGGVVGGANGHNPSLAISAAPGDVVVVVVDTAGAGVSDDAASTYLLGGSVNLDDGTGHPAQLTVWYAFPQALVGSVQITAAGNQVALVVAVFTASGGFAQLASKRTVTATFASNQAGSIGPGAVPDDPGDAFFCAIAVSDQGAAGVPTVDYGASGWTVLETTAGATNDLHVDTATDFGLNPVVNIVVDEGVQSPTVMGLVLVGFTENPVMPSPLPDPPSVPPDTNCECKLTKPKDHNGPWPPQRNRYGSPGRGLGFSPRTPGMGFVPPGYKPSPGTIRQEEQIETAIKVIFTIALLYGAWELLTPEFFAALLALGAKDPAALERVAQELEENPELVEVAGEDAEIIQDVLNSQRIRDINLERNRIGLENELWQVQRDLKILQAEVQASQRYLQTQVDKGCDPGPLRGLFDSLGDRMYRLRIAQSELQGILTQLGRDAEGPFPSLPLGPPPPLPPLKLPIPGGSSLPSAPPGLGGTVAPQASIPGVSHSHANIARVPPGPGSAMYPVMASGHLTGGVGSGFAALMGLAIFNGSGVTGSCDVQGGAKVGGGSGAAGKGLPGGMGSPLSSPGGGAAVVTGQGAGWAYRDASQGGGRIQA